jgi:hypothetical protein
MKLYISRQIFEKSLKNQIHKNPSSERSCFKRANVYDEANIRFSQYCERAKQLCFIKGTEILWSNSRAPFHYAYQRDSRKNASLHVSTYFPTFILAGAYTVANEKHVTFLRSRMHMEFTTILYLKQKLPYNCSVNVQLRLRSQPIRVHFQELTLTAYGGTFLVD